LYQGVSLPCGDGEVHARHGGDGTNWRGLNAPMPSRNARYSFSIASKWSWL
jgi:hypothetical protein